MAQRKTLTADQVEVLRWIASDRDDQANASVSIRITAAALRNRGLATTSGRGPTWSASITSAGRAYLEQVDSDDPPTPRQPNTSVTQQFIDDVVAAGGTLRLPQKSWYHEGEIDYAHRARLAEQHGRVPPGKRLRIVPISRDELEVQLLDEPGRTTGRADLVPIEIPRRVARYHPAARAYRELRERHEVSRVQLSRATTIVHVLANEAERRGWTAQEPAESKNGYGRLDWTGTKDGHLQITTDTLDFRLRLHEDGVHTRGSWENEWRYYERRGTESYDTGATGILRLELGETRWRDHSGRQSRWADRNSWTLEERLPHLFREIEGRIIESHDQQQQAAINAERERQAAQRAAEERQRTWGHHIQAAKERLIQTHRAETLRSQADAWQTTQRLREYCDALEDTFGGTEPEDWLRWAREYIRRLDPLSERPRMPEDPEITAEALQVHMPAGWSAEGPEHGRTRAYFA